MLAHLHASLNFAIYSLMNPNFRAGFVTRLMACCRRVTSVNARPSSAVTAAASAAPCVISSCDVHQSRALSLRYSRRLAVNQTFAAVEYQHFQETDGATAELTPNASRRTISLENLTVAPLSFGADN